MLFLCHCRLIWSKESGQASNLTKSGRAHEMLDFEAAAEAIEKGQSGGSENVSSISSNGLQFTSVRVEVMFQSTTNDFSFLSLSVDSSYNLQLFRAPLSKLKI